jgi:hypothetical protein
MRSKAGSFLMMPLALLVLLGIAAGTLVSYLLWPTWNSAAVALGAPEMPITVAGVLFDVPSASIRAAVQRQPGPHERIDLVFLWPSLTPPPADGADTEQPAAQLEDDAAPAASSERLFVTIAGLGGVLPPAKRLRGIYPHYVEAEASAGPDGLAILPFRPGTPYDGEDLVYLAANAEQFFARCTRQIGVLPGTCIHERSIEGAEIILRFPREWLDDWRTVAAGFDQLMARLHPQAEDGRGTTGGT